jgi:hypothetical protein
MKRIVGLFVEGVQVELFNDEQISVNSSVQNISDISKVFTDFSQSFTVPASPHNNNIFQYFYESDLEQTIDQNLRRNAFIEIDLTFFRRGKIQLEKSNVKNGQVDSYTVTFYGDVLALKDKFGEDKLRDLNLTPYEVPFTGTEVYDRITDLTTDYDVRYPLIASTRLWTYNVGPENICSTSKAIQYYELFPAIKISKLFEAIQNDYGITFQGTFLQDDRFTQCFLWAKNTLSFDFFTAPEDIDFTSKLNINDANWLNLSSQNAEDFVDLTTNSINLQDFNPNVYEHKIQIEVLSLTPVGTIYINVFQDGNLLQTFITSIVNVFNVIIQNTSGLNTNITYQITGANVTDVECVIYYEAWAYYLGLPIRSLCVIQTATTSVTANLTLAKYMPDMKVSDFFAGVLKDFNMTCVGIEKDVYEVLPLDDWYSQGAIVDVTEYTNTDEIGFERMKLYKKISFKYQESESFANKNYFKTYNQQYGNLDYQFNYDGSDYVIESPFENLLFTRALDNSSNYAILGYSLNDNYQPYTPKPCLMYLYGASDSLVHDIKFYDGSTHLNIDTYALFGQDLTYQNTKYSLNFGADNSIIHNETIQQGLYATYYFPYLSNLFNLKQRLVTVKTILPISLLTNLRLNDRLIIRDKRYIINEMKSNLTNGEVEFSLYLDFRPLQAQDIINPDPTAQCLDVRVQMVNKAVSATITTATAGVTITPSTITTSQAIEVCIPANLNTPSLLLAENNDPIITEDYLNFITENSSSQVITLIVTYTFSDGSQSTNQIIINQQ